MSRVGVGFCDIDCNLELFSRGYIQSSTDRSEVEIATGTVVI